MNKNENIAVNVPAKEAMAIFNNPALGTTFSSFSPDDIEGKMRLYNAINSPERKLADFINTKINVRDVVVCMVKLAAKRDDDSEVNPFESASEGARTAFRVILIDTDGVAYSATSNGIYNSVCTLRSVFGDLSFPDGLPMVVKQVQVKNGNTLTLSIAK